MVHHLSSALTGLTVDVNLPIKFVLQPQVQQADDLIDTEIPAHVRNSLRICKTSATAVSDWAEMQVSCTSDLEPATSSDHGVTLSATASPRKGVQLDSVLHSQSVLMGISTSCLSFGWQPAHSPPVTLHFLVFAACLICHKPWQNSAECYCLCPAICGFLLI